MKYIKGDHIQVTSGRYYEVDHEIRNNDGPYLVMARSLSNYDFMPIGPIVPIHAETIKAAWRGKTILKSAQ